MSIYYNSTFERFADGTPMWGITGLTVADSPADTALMLEAGTRAEHTQAAVLVEGPDEAKSRMAGRMYGKYADELNEDSVRIGRRAARDTEEWASKATRAIGNGGALIALSNISIGEDEARRIGGLSDFYRHYAELLSGSEAAR